jgi:hypothetical protein
MRIVRALALVLLGIAIGGGLILAGERVAAKSSTSSERLELGQTLSAGQYHLRFIKDTATGTCYLAGVSPDPAANTRATYEITAITQAHVMACDVNK